MRIEQFEYLIDIEKTRSITQTAENFFISRQVVSSNIRAMETELGVQLLIRRREICSSLQSEKLQWKKPGLLCLPTRIF